MSFSSSLWSRENIAWAAGMFEGEGCVQNKSLSLVSTDEDVIRRFAEIVGGGKIKQRKSTGHLGKKIQWEWVVHRQEYLQALVAAFWPWLGSRRRAACEKALANMRTGYLRRINRGSKNGNSKLCVEQVREIRASADRPTDLAKRFSVTLTNIRDIQLRKTWRHLDVVL